MADEWVVEVLSCKEHSNINKCFRCFVELRNIPPGINPPSFTDGSGYEVAHGFKKYHAIPNGRGRFKYQRSTNYIDWIYIGPAPEMATTTNLAHSTTEQTPTTITTTTTTATDAEATVSDEEKLSKETTTTTDAEATVSDEEKLSKETKSVEPVDKEAVETEDEEAVLVPSLANLSLCSHNYLPHNNGGYTILYCNRCGHYIQIIYK